MMRRALVPEEYGRGRCQRSRANLCVSDKRVYQKALFVFMRDLRLYDNTGLTEAARTSDAIVACFICAPLPNLSTSLF